MASRRRRRAAGGGASGLSMRDDMRLLMRVLMGAATLTTSRLLTGVAAPLRYQHAEPQRHRAARRCGRRGGKRHIGRSVIPLLTLTSQPDAQGSVSRAAGRLSNRHECPPSCRRARGFPGAITNVTTVSARPFDEFQTRGVGANFADTQCGRGASGRSLSRSIRRRPTGHRAPASSTRSQFTAESMGNEQSSAPAATTTPMVRNLVAAQLPMKRTAASPTSEDMAQLP